MTHRSAARVVRPALGARMGWNFGCALRTSGAVACWGLNDRGKSTPAEGTFKQVATGFNHACGTKSDGLVVCWGSNDFGEGSPPPVVPTISSGCSLCCQATPRDVVSGHRGDCRDAGWIAAKRSHPQLFSWRPGSRPDEQLMNYESGAPSKWPMLFHSHPGRRRMNRGRHPMRCDRRAGTDRKAGSPLNRARP
jgi:hypothetical protein